MEGFEGRDGEWSEEVWLRTAAEIEAERLAFKRSASEAVSVAKRRGAKVHPRVVQIKSKST